MADQFLFNKALEGTDMPDPFIEKEVLMVQDVNGGVYNGQINLDTSTLASSRKWCDYSSAYLEIPFIIAMKSSVDISATAAANSFAMGLKCGAYQLIDSIQVDYNNTNVIQQQPFTNFYVQYKMMTSLSEDDVKKWGPSILFAPDSSGSITFSAGGNGSGQGTCNNIVNSASPFFDYTRFDTHNEGYLKRLKMTGYEPAAPSGSNTEINSATLCNNVALNYFTNNAGGGAANIYYWNVVAIVKLSSLSDFFSKLPVVKGGFLRFSINYNSTAQTITTVGASPVTSMTITTSTQLSGRTNPMMLTSGIVDNPLEDLLAGVLSISCGVRSTSIGATTVTNPILSSCRLYVPAYTMNPSYEAQLLSARPVREVVYQDIYNYVISNKSGDFNEVITNGIVSPQQIVVIPVLNNAAGNAATASLTPYQSPFDSCPGTTAPFAAITNFNVVVSGRNVFQSAFRYDFEQFMNETAGNNSLNGGISTGLSSGLIGQLEWSSGYRYYSVDLSRRLPLEDDVPVSISVQGTNNTSKIMDYIVFVSYNRRITIDMLTGALQR
jgi:hypothetical protein